MFGWFSDASVLASRWKRASRSRIVREGFGQDFDRDLTTKSVSVARHTSPMPPTPIWAEISYGPRRVPAVRATASGCDYRRCRGESGYITSDGDQTRDLHTLPACSAVNQLAERARPR